MELISEEVNDYKMIDNNELPKAVSEAADNGDFKLKADIIWHHLNYMRRPVGQERFPRLSKIALLVLTIPHSNAEERVCSIIKKKKNSNKSSLN